MTIRKCIYCGSSNYELDHIDWEFGLAVYVCDECGRTIYSDDFIIEGE